MKLFSYIILLPVFLAACSTNPSKKENTYPSLQQGEWKITFSTQGYNIPVLATYNGTQLTILNADEKISMPITLSKDSFYISIPNFSAHLAGHILSETKMEGYFTKENAKDYNIPFTLVKTKEARFIEHQNPIYTLQTKYEITIDRGERKTKAIGLFHQNNNVLSGSFATETGDYRFLDGIVDGKTLKLSTFDGSHLFLFTADIKGDSLINGNYISGKTGHYTWVGKSNPSFKLRNPEKLTYLKNANETSVNFKLISTDGDSISLSDKKFEGKVKLIQIMGTWCPNCLDETRYFTQLYSAYKNKGLEIIAIAFENGTDTQKILEKLNKYKNTNGIKYSVLYGGKAGSQYAEEVFPQLNKIMSFPTTIYLDKNNNVRKIYTGFYGPGTGEYYLEYTTSTENFIQNLLKE